VIKRLQTIGWIRAPISDRLSTYGFVKWTKACKKAELQPIYGVELPVGEGDHWAFFSINDLHSLHGLIYQATSADGRPRLSYQQAMAPTDLIKITGHLVDLQQCPPQLNLFVPLTPSLPIGQARKAQAMGHEFIATSDNAYINAADKELYRVALGKRADVQTYPQHIMDDAEWRQSVRYLANEAIITRALVNRDFALMACNATMRHAALLKPKVNVTLRQLCEAGAQRTGTDLTDPVYAARLERELALIEEKKFADYFFILADLMAFAKEVMVCGPARGSSCGSLVCYLLNITTVDPIPFGLLFERFIDINRNDLPDIDIDLSDERRHLMFEYAEQKYGRERVARLGTVLLFRPRSILKQAGISLRIAQWEIAKVVDTIIERSGGDSRALQTLEDSFNDTETGRAFITNHPEAMMMAPLEGHPVVAGQHAGGIVITNEPITNFVALDGRTGAVMCDKKDAEDLNLLKIDALGLTQLSIFERTLELIGVPPKSGWLERLRLDDQATFEVFRKGHFAGIFQFNGQVLQSVTKQIDVKHINDIIQITAIARPGPAASGGTLSWVRRRTGQEEPTTVHPMLTELTKETFGVIIFQEQVMKVVREMGSMSWEDTSAIRKAMSGRLGDEFFQSYTKKFIAGAVANGVSEAMAEAVWNQINTMGSWAFNQSHAVAYGLVSYYCAYLKAHHPLEFAAATLDAEKLPERQIALLRELKEEGIDYKSFDADHSTDHWTPLVQDDGTKILIGPLTSIKGIGPAFMQEILTARANGEPIRDVLRNKLAEGKTEIDSLFPISDAIKAFWPSLADAGIASTPTPCKDVQVGINRDVVVLGLAERLAPIDENEPIRVMRRNGRKFPPPTEALNIFLRDDTDRLLCRVDRFNYPNIGRPVVERGKPGKVLYALKGFVPRNFRMLMVQRIKWLGDLDTSMTTEIHGGTHTNLPAGEQSP
jgi:DNA polymerase III alpha subunit